MGDLRALSVTQQVGLLFVTIFGLLVLTTLVALSRSLRERTAAQQATYWRFRRDLRAVIGGVPVELEHLHAVEPVFHRAIGPRHDARVLPHVDLGRDSHVGHQPGAWQHVVERGQCAIAVTTQLRVRVTFVVENLVLETQRGIADRVTRRGQ